jgi:SAM-dependent methyltransferase
VSYRGSQPLAPGRGYDLASSHYEAWHWFKFWRLNEAPIVRRWLGSIPHGVGLDAGAGIGAYLAEISMAQHRHVAIDLSSRMLSIQRGRARAFPGVLLGSSQADAAALPFADARFDWVLCTRVLSHVPDASAVLLEFNRVLHVGGECLISDVHPSHPYTHVSVQTDSSEIRIETFKHSVTDLRRAIQGSGLKILSFQEYRLAELAWQPPREAFGKLYRNLDTPVLYVCRVRRP